jgi:heptosyltransferase-1
MESVLIIRPSSIGDIVMASPMIKVLREAYPKAYIAWLVEPSACEVLRHHPALDELICWPKTQWERLLKQGRFLDLAREVRKLISIMRARNFDMALDAQGLLRSRVLAFLSGAPKRVGLDSREPGRFLMTRICFHTPNNKRMGSEYYELMQDLGLSPKEFHPDVVVSIEDQRAAECQVHAKGIGKNYAVICPFTTRPQKHWFIERWADLSAAIHARLGLPTIVLGGPRDVDGSRRIQALGQVRVYDLTGKMTLGQAAAIIKNSTLVVGVDTGLTHMGVAFDRPTIALFGATCPYRHTASPSTMVLYDELPCSPCRRSPTCNGDFTCMKSISVEQILQAAENLLKRPGIRQCTSCT